MRLLIATAIAALLPAGATAQPPVQAIALYSYGYAPNPIRLQAGQPVTLHFVNRAGKGHDFTAQRFFRSARILSGSVRGGEIDLAPGETSRITLVPVRGTYKVHCGHFFHKQMGMRGTIVVE